MVSISRKYSVEEVAEFFRQRDCILLSETYLNNKQKLDYICSCGNKSQIQLNKLLLGRKCRECGIQKAVEERRHSLEYVREYFQKQGCRLLSEQYENNRTKLRFICSCGKEYKATFDTFKKSNRCRECWKKSLAGSSNPNYNETLSDEYRSYKRVLPEYVKWRSYVFKRDNFTCVKCSKNSTYLQAHHLDGFHWCVDRRYDPTNGVTLCVKCHSDFHDVYGRHFNTQTQFNEWIRKEGEKSA